jgi:hypothetical protein
MIITAVALILFIVLVGVTLLGGHLRRLLPEEQLSAESKDDSSVHRRRNKWRWS